MERRAPRVGARLAELAAQYALPDETVPRLEALLALVAEDEAAPTTVRDPVRGVDAHVADSLSAVAVEPLRRARRIADLGAGAGFPGLVLAAALPSAHVTLVESVRRKCAFLERAVERMQLTNADIVCARAEEWREGLGALHVVTVRAVAPLNVLAEYAAPLLVVGGHLIAYKGVRDPAEEADARVAADEVGLDLAEIRRVAPSPGADRRHLYVYSKVRPTPSRFPRRAGMARKRPISRRT